jgi:hypothetical protein
MTAPNPSIPRLGAWHASRLTKRSSQPLDAAMTSSQHVYEIRPGSDKRGVDLISDVLPFGGLWYDEPDAISNAIGYALASLIRGGLW